MQIEEILDPISFKEFRKEYQGRKFFYVKTKNKDRFSHLYSWEMFDRYLNDYRNVNNLSVIDPPVNVVSKREDNVFRKGEDDLLKKKKNAFHYWREGCSFVLPFAEYQNEAMVEVCETMEFMYGDGQANIYCSPTAESKSFPPHVDSTENFLIHIDGKIKWTIYKDFWDAKRTKKEHELTVAEEFELSEGDLLYLPKGQYHKAISLSQRISISFHFPKQKKYKGNKFFRPKRDHWYDWEFWK